MRIILISLFFFFSAFAFSQRGKQIVSLNTLQKAAVYCFLFQPQERDSCTYILPNRYLNGVIWLRLKYNTFNDTLWHQKLPLVFDAMYRNVIGEDNIRYYSQPGSIMIMAIDSVNRKPYTINPNEIKGQKFTIDEKMEKLAYGLPFHTTISITRCEHKCDDKRPSMAINIYSSSYLLFPADKSLRKAYATMLSIAICEILGKDREKYGPFRFSFYKENKHDLEDAFAFSVPMVENFIKEFDSFIKK